MKNKSVQYEYMKQVLVIAVAFILGATAVEAGAKLIKGTEYATVGVGTDMVTVYKVQDGQTTCYVSRHGKFGAHAISCVK